MPRLIQFPAASPGETCEDVLRRALAAAADGAFDEIVIVAQRAKPGTGLAWFGRDEGTLATTIYLLQGALFWFNCVGAGIKL